MAILFYLVVGVVGLSALVARDCNEAAERARAAEVPPPLAGPGSQRQLAFGRAALVSRTDVLRVDLVRQGSGYDSGSYAEVRNILFLDPATKAGRWLLPDSDHVIAESLEIEREAAPNVKQVLAIAGLIKPLGGDLRIAEGRLLLFDPSGKTVEALADGVRTLHVAAIGQGSEYLVMYERQRKFVVATVDPVSLKARGQQVFEVPSLESRAVQQ
jgi:hypothetical protein